jgi:predicted permease
MSDLYEGARSLLFDLTGELRLALRALRATPLFTAVTVLMLALGMGATTAIFSLVNGVLLKPLPFREPSRLAIVQTTVREIRDRYPVLPANPRSFLAWQEGCRHTCGELTAMSASSATLSGEGEPENLRGALVSSNFFDMLGIPPLSGRTFRRDDAAAGSRVVILTHALWSRRFGGRPVIGRRITLDGQSFEIVGILPPWLHVPRFESLYPIRAVTGSPEYFRPLVWSEEERQNAGDFDDIAILRLKAGASPQQAQEELTPLTEAAFRGTPIHPTPLVRRLDAHVVSGARRSLWLLLGAVVAALLVACVNVANLLGSRWMGRRRELAVRTAMGAGRGDLIRHVLVETMCLAGFGGALGVLFAHVFVRGLLVLAPVDLPRLDEVALDLPTLTFSATMMLASCLFCAVLPVVRAGRTRPAEVLKAGAHTTTDTAGWARARSLFVGAEVALSACLLIVAGLLLASFVRVLTLDPGFAVERRLGADFTLSTARYRTMEERVRFVERLLPAVRAIHDVERAAIVQILPLEGEATVDAFLPDYATTSIGLQTVGNHYFASPDYFAAMGIPVVRGRTFAESDRGRRVAVVTEQTARTLWPGQEAIGRRFSRSRREQWEVIGIVADARLVSLERPGGLVAYVPYWERTAPDVSLVLRTSARPEDVAGELRQAVRRLDPELPVMNVRTLSEVVERSVAARRFQLTLTLAFAAAGLVIACLGIYGVVAASVQRRRPELAIRLALGGSPQGVLLLVARQGFQPVLAGLTVGVGAAAAGAGAIRGMLFDVSPTDPGVMLLVSLVVLGVAALACLEPALRAARTPPLIALRES